MCQIDCIIFSLHPLCSKRTDFSRRDSFLSIFSEYETWFNLEIEPLPKRKETDSYGMVNPEVHASIGPLQCLRSGSSESSLARLPLHVMILVSNRSKEK